MTNHRLTRLLPFTLPSVTIRDSLPRQLMQRRDISLWNKKNLVDHIAVFYFKREKLEEPVATP